MYYQVKLFIWVFLAVFLVSGCGKKQTEMGGGLENV